MIDKILTNLQNFPGQVYNVAYKAVMAPPREVWGLAGAAICVGSIASYLLSRFESSEPNEWLLIIKDGKLKRSGVGLKTFVFPDETVVRFPSLVQRVEFTAMNITLEMQGVSIEGYAFWSVNRNDDGPFKCYKYMQGGSANDNVRTLCESIIRNELANSKLQDVLTNRNQLRDNVKRELEPQLRGWGVWLETV